MSSDAKRRPKSSAATFGAFPWSTGAKRATLAIAAYAIAQAARLYLLRRVRGASMAPTLHAGDVIAVVPSVGSVVVGDIVEARQAGRTVIKRVAMIDEGGDIHLHGDNVAESTDSRTLGPVTLADITGRVVGRVWPNPSTDLSASTATEDAPPRR